jgi:hypothetical protein
VIRLITVLLGLLVGAGGCAGGTGPASDPAGPTSAAPTGQPPSGALGPTSAPRVDVPRDARGIAACNLLTDDQQVSLGVDPATAVSTAQGDAGRCRWRTLDGTGSLGVNSAPDFPVGGLEGLYLVRSTYDVFEPGELQGYPTVRADRADTGDSYCTIYVGVADDQLVWTSAAFVGASRSACETARQMASNVLSNLPPLG